MLRGLLALGTLGSILVAGTPAAQAHDPILGVSPATVSTNLNPATSTVITKTVHTSTVPPNPDIVLLSDTTGSMGSAIANVKANATGVIGAVKDAQPTSFFAAAQFKDREHSCGDPFDVKVDQALTADDAAVVAGIGQWNASGGCDFPENWLLALHYLATDPAIGFRTGSTRIVTLFGDAVAHDDGGPSLAATIAALQAADIRVVLVNVGNLDGAGQASAIANATGGVLLNGTMSNVSASILAGIMAIPVTVTPVAACDAKLTASFDAASKSVTSGDDAIFTETLTLAADAPQGSTLTCTVKFLVDGKDLSGYTQTASIKVNDVTAPVAACSETQNPSGKNIPTAGPNAGKSGQNPDGFYVISATDNVDSSPQVFVRDAGSGTTFGPYPTGTRIKYTQAAGAKPEAKLIGDGVLHITGVGDAEVFATDASGNVASPVSCLVPAPPK